MNEKLEEELNKWWKEYKDKEKELLKKYPLKENTLNNNHPINQLEKEYMDKKKEIISKYSTK